MKMRAIVVGLVVLVAAAVGTVLIARNGNAVTTAPPPPATPADPYPNAPPVSKTGPHPKAVIEKTQFEFGTMGVNEVRKHSFEIANKGEATLVLKPGTPTCKCTVSGVDTNEVPVGGTAHVELTWEPKTPQAGFQQTAPIYTNDPNSREIRLVIKGDVAEVLTVEPGGTWSLGDIGEEPVSVSGAIYSRTLDKFEITGLESEDPNLKVEHTPLSEEELKERKAKSGYTLKATLTPGEKVGPVTTELKVKTDVNGHSEFKLTLNGARPGPLRFIPIAGTVWHPEVYAVNLGEFPASEGKKARLILFVDGMGDEEFQFTDIQSDTPFLKAELTREGEFKPGMKQRFSLTFEAPPGVPAITKVRGNSARIVVKTNHPRAAEITFRVEMISL